MLYSDAYRYGYDIGKTGNFHHETRGPDGITYGCYGYIDPFNHLRATHYVADTHGYRTVEPKKPVEVFPEPDDEISGKKKGYVLQWEELYFPIGCGKFEGGVHPDIPYITVDETKNTQFNFQSNKPNKFPNQQAFPIKPSPASSNLNAVNANNNVAKFPQNSNLNLADQSNKNGDGPSGSSQGRPGSFGPDGSSQGRPGSFGPSGSSQGRPGSFGPSGSNQGRPGSFGPNGLSGPFGNSGQGSPNVNTFNNDGQLTPSASNNAFGSVAPSNSQFNNNNNFGPNGPNGTNGPSGPNGPKGPNGPNGPNGPKGPNGPNGPNAQFSSSIGNGKIDSSDLYGNRRVGLFDVGSGQTYSDIPGLQSPSFQSISAVKPDQDNSGDYVAENNEKGFKYYGGQASNLGADNLIGSSATLNTGLYTNQGGLGLLLGCKMFQIHPFIIICLRISNVLSLALPISMGVSVQEIKLSQMQPQIKELTQANMMQALK